MAAVLPSTNACWAAATSCWAWAWGNCLATCSAPVNDWLMVATACWAGRGACRGGRRGRVAGGRAGERLGEVAGVLHRQQATHHRLEQRPAEVALQVVGGRPH